MQNVFVGHKNLKQESDFQVDISTTPTIGANNWDDFVAGSTQAHYAQTTSWASYRKASGWNTYFLTVRNQGQTVASCLALHKSIKNLAAGGVIYVSRGPVFAPNLPNRSQVAELMLRELIKLTRRKIAVLRISPDFQSDDTWLKEILAHQRCQTAAHAIQHTSTMRLDLRKTSEELISAMRRSRRFEVRKFERERPPAWTISFECSNNNLATFHQMYVDTLKRQGNSYKSLEELQRLSEHLQAPKMNLALMYYQDQPVAGAILLGHGRRLWYLYGGSAKGDKLISKAGVYLQWEIIKWGKAQEYTKYDLHGIPLESKAGDPFHGVYTFKKGFGGKMVELIGEYEYSQIPFMNRLLERHLSML